MTKSKMVFLSIMTLFLSCSNESNPSEKKDLPLNISTNMVEYTEKTGRIQGTTYTVIFEGDEKYLENIHNILVDVDQVLSLWIPESELCLFNKDSTTQYAIDDPHEYFKDVFEDSKYVYEKTSGYFDPSINKLVEKFGFGLNDTMKFDLEEMKFQRGLYSFKDEKVKITNYDRESHALLIKKDDATSLNFNAIAQGYAVDAIADFLDSKDVKNYMVEIGGELSVKGLNKKGVAWTIGIEQPSEFKRSLNSIIKLTDNSLATSGSYRNYLIEGGKKYSHTINPVTGLPSSHSLVSVTVLMNSCALADAYATAFMAMGKEKTITFLSNHPEEEIEVLLIFEEGSELNTFLSPGFNIEQ